MSTAGSALATPANTPTSAPVGVRLLGWGSAALAVSFLRNGLWGTPNIAFFTTISQRLGENPFAGTDFDGDYLMSNLAGQAIAKMFGQTEPHQYARLHLVVFLVLSAAVIAAAYRRFGYGAARALIAVMAFAPATTVTMMWLGQPDALTYPLALAIVIARPPWARVVLGVALGLSHAEQGVAAALIAGIAAVAIDRFVHQDGTATAATRWPGSNEIGLGVRAAGWPLVGVIIGRAVIQVYFGVNDITITTPRTSFLSFGASNFVDHHLTSPIWLLYSLWGPLWALGVWAAVRSRRPSTSAGERLAWVTIGIGALAGLAPMLITLDQTRVYSMVTAPLLVAIAVGVSSTAWREESTRLGWRPVLVVLVLIFVPGMFNAGDAYSSLNIERFRFTQWLITGELDPYRSVTSFLMGPFGFEPPDI